MSDLIIDVCKNALAYSAGYMAAYVIGSSTEPDDTGKLKDLAVLRNWKEAWKWDEVTTFGVWSSKIKSEDKNWRPFLWLAGASALPAYMWRYGGSPFYHSWMFYAALAGVGFLVMSQGWDQITTPADPPPAIPAVPSIKLSSDEEVQLQIGYKFDSPEIDPWTINHKTPKIGPLGGRKYRKH